MLYGGLPGGSDHKEFSCNAGDLGSIHGSGRSPGEGNATHSSILAWRIPWTEEPGGLQSGVTKSQTQLSDKHFHFFFFSLSRALNNSLQLHRIEFRYFNSRSYSVHCWILLLLYSTVFLSEKSYKCSPSSSYSHMSVHTWAPSRWICIRILGPLPTV